MFCRFKEVLRPQKTQKIGSANRKSAKYHISGRSANLRSLFPDRPPLKISKYWLFRLILRSFAKIVQTFSFARKCSQNSHTCFCFRGIISNQAALCIFSCLTHLFAKIGPISCHQNIFTIRVPVFHMLTSFAFGENLRRFRLQFSRNWFSRKGIFTFIYFPPYLWDVLTHYDEQMQRKIYRLLYEQNWLENKEKNKTMRKGCVTSRSRSSFWRAGGNVGGAREAIAGSWRPGEAARQQEVLQDQHAAAENLCWEANFLASRLAAELSDERLYSHTVTTTFRLGSSESQIRIATPAPDCYEYLKKIAFFKRVPVFFKWIINYKNLQKFFQPPRIFSIKFFMSIIISKKPIAWSQFVISAPQHCNTRHEFLPVAHSA